QRPTRSCAFAGWLTVSAGGVERPEARSRAAGAEQQAAAAGRMAARASQYASGAAAEGAGQRSGIQTANARPATASGQAIEPVQYSSAAATRKSAEPHARHRVSASGQTVRAAQIAARHAADAGRSPPCSA